MVESRREFLGKVIPASVALYGLTTACSEKKRYTSDETATKVNDFTAELSRMFERPIAVEFVNLSPFETDHFIEKAISVLRFIEEIQSKAGVKAYSNDIHNIRIEKVNTNIDFGFSGMLPDNKTLGILFSPGIYDNSGTIVNEFTSLLNTPFVNGKPNEYFSEIMSTVLNTYWEEKYGADPHQRTTTWRERVNIKDGFIPFPNQDYSLFTADYYYWQTQMRQSTTLPSLQEALAHEAVLTIEEQYQNDTKRLVTDLLRMSANRDYKSDEMDNALKELEAKQIWKSALVLPSKSTEILFGFGETPYRKHNGTVDVSRLIVLPDGKPGIAPNDLKIVFENRNGTESEFITKKFMRSLNPRETFELVVIPDSLFKGDVKFWIVTSSQKVLLPKIK